MLVLSSMVRSWLSKICISKLRTKDYISFCSTSCELNHQISGVYPGTQRPLWDRIPMGMLFFRSQSEKVPFEFSPSKIGSWQQRRTWDGNGLKTVHGIQDVTWCLLNIYSSQKHGVKENLPQAFSVIQQWDRCETRHFKAFSDIGWQNCQAKQWCSRM